MFFYEPKYLPTPMLDSVDEEEKSVQDTLTGVHVLVKTLQKPITNALLFIINY